jgi:hypothetical protein
MFYLITVLFTGKETVFWSLPFATRELCIETRAVSELVSTRSGSVISYCADKRPSKGWISNVPFLSLIKTAVQISLRFARPEKDCCKD